MRPIRIALASITLLAASVALGQTAPLPITVQVINDSGVPDAQVYLLLAGKDVTAAPLANGALPFYPFSAAGINATPAGTVTNTSGALVTSAFTAGPASAPLTVTAGGSTIAMSFAPATVTSDTAALWTIKVPNPGTTATTLVLPFNATLPQGVTTTSSASTGTCAGVSVAATEVTMADGQSIPAGGCTIVVSVQAASVVAPATVTASTSYLQAGFNEVPASAPLAVVVAQSTLSMAFAPASIAVGDPSTLTLTLPNATGSAVALSADFVNAMPEAVVIQPATAGGTCPGTSVTATAVSLPAGTMIPAGGCTIVVGVTSISTGGPLTGLARALDPDQAPLVVSSPYSGRSRPVYQFSMSTVSSGNLYLSYNTPVVTPPAPTVTARYRFQALEFSYSQFIASNGDLTSIDYYGIPLELQTFAPGDTALVRAQDRVTYYTSTASLLRAFTAVNRNFKYAFMRTDGTPFDPATDSLADFARIVGPNQLAAPGTSPILWPASAPAGYTGTWPPTAGSPWPYPSFADYLDKLVATGYQFVESDDATISAYKYNYTGTIAGDRGTGYTITLVGADCDDPVITLFLPPQASSGGGFDFLVYGIPQNCDTLQVSGFDCTSANVQTLTNSVYGWIQADVMAALNFGYMNGVADAGTQGIGQASVWYGLPPVQYPFGWARSTNDGYYNPWAALMYNHSDAYGFAFSDRSGRPSPDIAFPVGGTLRIWILPDVRLDAPQPRVTAEEPTKIKLAWPIVADADHYVVTWSPPYATASAKVAQPSPGSTAVLYDVADLAEGTPYTITVRAFNADASQSSFELPVVARTLGGPKALAGANAHAVVGFNWKPPASMDGEWPDVYVAGSKFTYDAVTGWSAPAPMGVLVGMPPSSAPLTVRPAQACSPPCITPTLSAAAIAPGAAATLTITISNPLSSSRITLPDGLSMPMPSGVTATSTTQTSCIGVNVTAGAITVGAVEISQTSPTCTIVATLTAATAGTYAIATPVTRTDAGTAPADSVALTVSGGASEVVQQFVPSVIDQGATATLAILIDNATGGPVTLTAPFIDVMPAGVSITGIAHANTAHTCGEVTLSPAVTATQLTLAAGAVIPAGGCTIAVYVTSSTPGTVINTTGMLQTTATVYPTHAYPMELRSGDDTIWSANLYLTFIGSPGAYAVGACQPTDFCAGSGLTPTVSFDTVLAPNFLERQAVGLTVSGGRAAPGPPFGAARPTIGIPFTPVANKKAAAVVYPALGSP